MSQRFWKTPTFKKLLIEWNRRLEEAGFKDAEDEKERLRQNASNSYRTTISEAIEGKQRYYELLAQGCAAEKEFRDFVEALVMKRRAKGIKIKGPNGICAELKKMNQRCHHKTIFRIIKFYEKKWQIKK